jgi:hypothetical protein
MTHEDGPPASLKILEITYSNFVTARALHAFAKLGLADLIGDRRAISYETRGSIV